jgi:MoxR-vWA-beta-propeller ternary system domain bpX4
MTLRDFLSRLSTDGVAAVTADEMFEPDDGWRDTVREWDAVQRRELAFSAPELSLAAAEWAALRLYRGCQALICRDVAPDDLRRFLAEPCLEPAGAAATVYSVDLVFRFLPDLVKLAQRVERGDPLVAELMKLARDWPLSSVGIADIGDVDAAQVLAHPSLRQLYIDRILAAGDTSRLHDPAVRLAARTSLGIFPALAPTIAAALDPSA